MINNFYKQLLALTLLLLPTLSRAQDLDNVMRSNNRIYVVISVLVLILVVLILYMIRIEKKLKNIEK